MFSQSMWNSCSQFGTLPTALRRFNTEVWLMCSWSASSRALYLGFAFTRTQSPLESTSESLADLGSSSVLSLQLLKRAYTFNTVDRPNVWHYLCCDWLTFIQHGTLLIGAWLGFQWNNKRRQKLEIIEKCLRKMDIWKYVCLVTYFMKIYNQQSQIAFLNIFTN